MSDTSRNASRAGAYDIVIVGAGPAGLSAALVLGRCRRNVLVCDSGHPRNAASHGVHCFLSRDGIKPHELLRLGREELRPFECVTLRERCHVSDASVAGDGFIVTLESGSHVTCRKLLLATGVVDDVPRIPGFGETYGSCVHHCPYCDGWEHRDRVIAIYGAGHSGAGLSLELTQWSDSVRLCTDGDTSLSQRDRALLARHDIPVYEERIVCLDESDGHLHAIQFADGTKLPCDAMFFSLLEHQRSDLPAKLGCTFTPDGAVMTNQNEATNVPGLYVAGDASRRAQFAIVAAAEGAMAAEAINRSLLRDDLGVPDLG
ncbi:MAG TPA: NAD(P)/FAD-dependent oxidoreductase [Ktedonobacterales bacterium]